jgi:uncharacterized membrane protein YheB (UPF0754 family)
MSDVLWIFLTVPAVAAFVGWGTNWLAVKMIFYPERFVGVGPIGWQGILPKNAEKFAQGVATTITTRLISAREMADRLDPAEMERLFEDTLDAQALEMVEEAAELIRPGAWRELPEPVRQTIVSEVRARARQITRELFHELRGISDEVLDLKKLIVSTLSGANTGRLSALFQRIGAKELFFIEWSGGLFGLAIGLLQATAYTALDRWWLMPAVGAIVGTVTNWLGIQMIFRPQERRRFFGLFSYQGMFAARQADIARDYGRTTADEVLTPKNLIRLVSEGEAGQRIARLVGDTVARRIEEEWSKVKAMVPIELGPETLAEIQRRVGERIVRTIPQVQPELEAYLERKLDIARTIEGKLASLPKAEFERVLRGLFEEDEIVLIAIGGFLGAGVGVLQAAWMLSRGL